MTEESELEREYRFCGDAEAEAQANLEAFERTEDIEDSGDSDFFDFFHHVERD